MLKRAKHRLSKAVPGACGVMNTDTWIGHSSYSHKYVCHRLWCRREKNRSMWIIGMHNPIIWGKSGKYLKLTGVRSIFHTHAHNLIYKILCEMNSIICKNYFNTLNFRFCKFYHMSTCTVKWRYSSVTRASVRASRTLSRLMWSN